MYFPYPIILTLFLKGKGKGRVLAIALLTRELVTRSALQSQKWQLIGKS